MNSLLRLQANRANALKSTGPVTEAGKLASAANSLLSTGPVTPEGKARSSQNALDHGLLARSLTLPGETPEAFLAHLESIKELIEPVGYHENYLAEMIAIADW